ncbi:MAG: hypothetical protein KAT65_13635 [Methanophagales archaeon]|nr:hypothetical protein [Methanophagales archaeon]
MSKSKNILFIARANNDLDHYLPLVVELKKHKEISSTILVLNNKYELLKNKLFNYICESNNIYIISLTDIFRLKRINWLLIHIYEYTLLHEKSMNNGSSLYRAFLKILQSITKKYISFHTLYLLTEDKIRDYIDLNNFDLVIIDTAVIEKSLLESKNPRFRFIKIAREKEIPILMIPHGPQMVYETPPDASFKGITADSIFKPDYTFFVNKRELQVLYFIRGLKDTFFLGDPRYDVNWINYLESCAMKVYDSVIMKPEDKKVLLYCLSNLEAYHDRYSVDSDYRFGLHKDVLSLVNYFPDLELWVKLHPRVPYEIPISDFIREDRRENIKQFGNDVDTNILIAKADIYISTGSTTVVNPIVKKKPVIFYDRWKEKVKDATTFLDDYSFILNLKASNMEELIMQCKKALNNEYEISDADIEEFYRNVFVKTASESMTEKYIKIIKHIMNENITQTN